MALVGKLEDLQLAELFHLLSLFRKSGKLTLTTDGATGCFHFKEGKIFHASNGQPRPALGELLVKRNLVSKPDLDIALRHQLESPEWRRLGTILVEENLVSRSDLDALLREQLQKVAGEFLHLTSGFFSFKPFETRLPEAVSASSEELDLAEGINTDGFILDLLTRLDAIAGLDPGPGPAPGPTPAAVGESQGIETGATDDLRTLLEYLVDGATIADLEEAGPSHFDAPDELGDLCSLMTEIQLRSPAYTGEIALMILRFASCVVNRGVLFHYGSDGITGIGQFGLEEGGGKALTTDARVRGIRIPTDQPSVFLDVAEVMQTYRGPLKPCRWNAELVRLLGGGFPDEIVAIPIVVDGMIAAVFYGDNGPDWEAIGPVKGLELLMIEAGLAMERRLLQAKLRRVEEQMQLLDRSAAHGSAQ